MPLKSNEKLRAIAAIIDGEWDNPELMLVGELMPTKLEMISQVLEMETEPWEAYVPDDDGDLEVVDPTRQTYDVVTVKRVKL